MTLLIRIWLLSSLTWSCAAVASGLLDQWLDHQSALSSWSADLVQTRTLKTLNKPLVNPGKVWFQRENLFRWQLGDPAKTVAIRSGPKLFIVYPRLKQLEEYDLEQAPGEMWQQVPALLEIGFPKERSSFYDSYQLMSESTQGVVNRFELKPLGNEGTQVLDRIFIELELERGAARLAATELTFSDGSIMRNVFSNRSENPVLSPSLFEIGDTDGFSVSTF